MNLQNLKTYFSEANGLGTKYPEHFNILNLIRLYPQWEKSLNSKSSPLLDRLPWLTFLAIQMLDDVLDENMRVYEYGSGGSTLYFAQRVKEVISVEHDRPWFEKVFESVDCNGHKNCHVQLIEPTVIDDLVYGDTSDPNSYISSSPDFTGKSFRDYVSNIDQFPDEYFDLILIDGRARPSCFQHSIPKVKLNGYIVWDNTDREHYLPTMKAAPSRFDFIDFPGASPYVNFFTRTSAWHRKY
jgi:hypothetical protein